MHPGRADQFGRRDPFTPDRVGQHVMAVELDQCGRVPEPGDAQVGGLRCRDRGDQRDRPGGCPRSPLVTMPGSCRACLADRSTWDGSVLWKPASVKCGDRAAAGRICERPAPMAAGRPRMSRPRPLNATRAVAAPPTVTRVAASGERRPLSGAPSMDAGWLFVRSLHQCHPTSEQSPALAKGSEQHPASLSYCPGWCSVTPAGARTVDDASEQSPARAKGS